MKLKTSIALLTALTGSSLSFASDPITDGISQYLMGSSDSAVPVTINGNIAAPDGSAGCSATTSELSFEFDNDEGEVPWVRESDGEYQLGTAPVEGGFIVITCKGQGQTQITFQTNNDFSEATYAQGAGYGSWPVIIGFDFASGDVPGQENFAEARVNGYLGTVSCDDGNGSSCVSTGTNLNKAGITANNVSDTEALEITANISGRLIAPAELYGHVQPSPRSPTPKLFVVYDGDTDNSGIPIFGDLIPSS